MNTSVVIPVLNSHEVVRRQTIHFDAMNLPDDVEIILVDDGSEPPLESKYVRHQTHDKRPWTWALARNAGAKIATGTYLIMTDIDHILTRDAIEFVRQFHGDKVQFCREFGVLTELGELTQDMDVLRQYGLKSQKLGIGPLPNNFAMRRELFFELGGYREDLIGRKYPQGEDRYFKNEWHKMRVAGRVDVSEHRPLIYMFPNGQFCGDVDYNPFGLFHTLSRKTSRNYWHQKLRAKI